MFDAFRSSACKINVNVASGTDKQRVLSCDKNELVREGDGDSGGGANQSGI